MFSYFNSSSHPKDITPSSHAKNTHSSKGKLNFQNPIGNHKRYGKIHLQAELRFSILMLWFMLRKHIFYDFSTIVGLGFVSEDLLSIMLSDFEAISFVSSGLSLSISLGSREKDLSEFRIWG